MININDKTRRLSQATIVIGYKQENKAESIEFEIPDYLKEYGKKICFKTKDGKVFSKLFNNTTSNIFTFTRTETQYGELDATIEFFKTENEDMVIYKTSMLHIIFNESIICEDEVQPDEPKIPILESLIEKVTDLNNTITENEETRNNNENTRISNENERKTNEKERETYYTNIQDKVNNGEFNGATYLPNVDAEGNISWTNNKGLENPSSQNIRGPQGIQGAQGEPFKIKKTYSSIEEMQTDFDNMKVGDYAMIANSVEIEDNAKLYYRTETEWVFITDFSGATGIQGPQGAQGIQGIQGERGIGISRLEVKDGYLYVTLTDNTQQNAGLIITDEVKQWIVNQVTDNAKSKFNTYYDGKVTDFDNHATVKTNEFNTNATNKVNEYNQNAESLINRVAECETENERLRNDIKSIALPGEASGENIHLEDSSDARCEIEIGGNHQQETREGYNQFKITSTQTQSAGVTITKIDESSVSYQGTTTGMFTHMLVEYDGKGLEITKQMYLKAFGNLTNAILSVKLIKNGKTESSYLRVSPDLILSAGDVLQQIYVQQQNTGILISGTLQVLLTDYENKDKPYEQYGASPSIDYPSKIKTVGSIKNILDMSNAKGGTSGGITCAVNEDGSYSYVGTASSKAINIWLLGSYSNKTSIFRLEPGTYYIDGVRLYDANNPLANPGTTKIFSFINAHDITGVRAPDAVSGNTYDETKYPIIAKIDHEIPWVPYNCGSVKVDIKNENIFNTENVKSTSEVSVVDNKNGLLKLQGVNGFWKGITTTQKFETGKRVYVKCKVVEGTGSSGNIGIKDTNGDDILENYKVSNNLISCSFISKGITKIFFRCNGTSNNGNIKYSDIMFSYEDIDYVPNQEQSYLVDVQQPMFEGDTFVRKDGKWYEKHCVKTEIMLTFPTTNIEVCGTFANFQINRNIAFAVVKNDLKITNVRNDILCDKLKTKDNSMWGGKEEGIQTYINSNKFMISIPFEDIEKNFGEELTINNYSQAFRKYINDNGPFKIYYLLAEPELIECTKAQSKVLDEIYNKAHTYKNITNISAESAEVNPIINIKYLKDAEKYIENKIKTALTEINANN